ncbi:hypothetical protein ACF07Y_35420 [Streptomyces sp. NPDC016566]|uniref:hypothetical protein n=1 Tax=Streptomyces sp. NPDC016566 TaxID=3364967 RepID=UPI0036F7911C
MRKPVQGLVKVQLAFAEREYQEGARVERGAVQGPRSQGEPDPDAPLGERDLTGLH